jgi:hypothetical protein
MRWAQVFMAWRTHHPKDLSAGFEDATATWLSDGDGKPTAVALQPKFFDAEAAIVSELRHASGGYAGNRHPRISRGSGLAQLPRRAARAPPLGSSPAGRLTAAGRKPCSSRDAGSLLAMFVTSFGPTSHETRDAPDAAELAEESSSR